MRALLRGWYRSALYRSVLGGVFCVALVGGTHAQAPVALRQIDVTATRLDTGAGTSTGTSTGTDSGIGAAIGIVGASTSIITAEDIARSPGQTLPGILAREPGVQVQSLFGGVNGARATVDLRGFGASGASNTLVLINGRRIDVPDLQGVDWSAIPLNSIERVEITRGNSGAVLYGDGAVGGVINIVTKTGVNVPSSAQIEGSFGSFTQREGRVSATLSSGDHALAFFGNGIRSDAYRQNNEYQQFNGTADYRYTKEWGSIYLNASGSDQKLGFPGGRRVDPFHNVNQLLTDPRGTDTPYDFGNQQQINGTAGVTFKLVPGAELIVDGGIRSRNQQSGFFTSCFDFFNFVSIPYCTPVPTNYVESALTTTSVTPRVKIDTNVFGLPWKGLSGVDYYHSDYGSPRGLFAGADPIHRYDLTQASLAAYSMNTVTVLSNTDLSAGGRVQRTTVSARDQLNPNAPGFSPLTCFPPFGCFGDTQGIPLDETETHTAFHFGAEHRFSREFAVFGRMAQSFRVPNVDERVGMAPVQGEIPTNFRLKAQVSHDVEAGTRINAGPVSVQMSLYDMLLTNEIFFSPASQSNINLDPTRRYGSETSVSVRVNDMLLVRGGLAYTRAVFREGIFAGKDVPLVSRHTRNVGVSWNIIKTQLVFDGDIRFAGSRYMDNDELNRDPKTPSYALVGVRLGGDIDHYFWSASIQNLFNRNYFDYAIASGGPPFPGPIGVFNAYSQPGRTYMLRIGAKI